MNSPDNGENNPQQPNQPNQSNQPRSGYPYGNPNSGQSPYGTSNSQGASGFGGTQTFQTNEQVKPVKEKRQLGTGSVVAIALVASLVAGGVSGYVAGNASSKTESYSSLDSPSVSSATPAAEGSVEAVAEQVLPAVVSIQVATRSGGSEGSGSIISSDGMILTNHHVVAEAANGQGEMQVTLNNGEKHSAKFVASDVNTDIALIKIDGVSNLPVLNFGDSSELHVGQEVVAVGSPLGLSATVTSGIVSALDRPVRASQGGGESSLIDAIQTDAAINPGNSGGPLVDMNGNLIGMNSVIASLSTTSESSGSIGLGFAIPSNFAKRVADQLVNTGKATQPMLGVQVDVQSTEDGALIMGVESGGPADKAGLREGDVVTKLNERTIQSADDLIAAARSHQFGETVTLEVHPRNSGETRTVDVTLSSE
ncbi:S1C family serine protease [Corynebacterium sp. S7]